MSTDVADRKSSRSSVAPLRPVTVVGERPEPTLVLCAHGTRDAAGARVVREIARSVAGEGIDVRLGYVDVQAPHIAEVTADLAISGREFVIVPLLLSAGHHVLVDIPAALQTADGVGGWPEGGMPPGAAAGGRAAPALGPDPLLADLLMRRLVEAGAKPDDGVVLAAAGSSRAEAAVDALRAAQMLRERWEGPVSVGYGASATPSVTEAVAELRTQARRVAIASYLIGPGHFHSRLAGCGADLLSAPLGADDAVVRLVLTRYQQSVSTQLRNALLSA
ncbi:MAG: sirohydrochlorin chelatase [Cumulibacter sp.]